MKKYTNPKTLKGQDKVNRAKDLMSRMTTLNESTSLSEIDFIKKGPNGIVYGIIRENHNYFIKTTEKTSGTLSSEDFDYSGGVKNKFNERYHSYAEALKHLNMKFDMLNESYGIEIGTNLFESDGVEVKEANASGLVKIKEVVDVADEVVTEPKDGENTEDVEELLDEDIEEVEEQKKVIKVDAPPAVEYPIEDEVEVDEFSVEDEGEDPFGDEEGGDMGDEEDGDETTKKIQKYTGKLGQLLRDKTEPDAELDKYVINSIISAIDWEEISDDDVEDIISKIEGEDEEDGEGVELDMDIDSEEVVDLDSEEVEDPFAEEEVVKESRVFSKKQLMESFLRNTTKKTLKKVLKENNRICEECLGEGCESCNVEEHHNMSHTNYGKFDRDEYMLDEKLKGGQHKLDRNKNRRIDAEDFKMMRKGKKQYMDEQIEEFDTFDDWKNSDYYPDSQWTIGGNSRSTVRNNRMSDGKPSNQHYFDKYRDQYGPFRVKPWEDSHAGTFGPDDNDLPWIDTRNRRLSGDINEDMDVMDAIATGQDYLSATRDLDRDGDQIPNRLDMDNDGDGNIDFEMGSDGNEGFIELDFDSIMGTEAPVKEPGIKEPTTRPGKGEKWKTIKRPKVDPRPKASDRPSKRSFRRRGMFR